MSPAPIPTPFAYEGLLYINGGRGGGLYALKPGASGDISLPRGGTSNDFVVWNQARGGTYLPTPLAYEGAIYSLTETGILSRYDAKTGKQTYKERLGTAGNFTTSPWAYNGKIFCLSEEGDTFVVSAGETFKMLHTNPLGEMAQATPALVGERLLIRTESKLYSIRKKT
jgi:outer membrane protein assembly factor BamB